jgi:phytoene dehydrogenase-like protein
VTAVSAANRTVRYAGPAGSLEIKADRIVFATDPLTAAQALRDRALAARIRAQDLAGTSGKLILIFRRPVRFHDDDGSADFHAAFRQILLHDTLAGFERATRATRGAIDFAPGFLELYCEGPAMERMGVKARFHIISVFFKNLGAAARGTQLAAVKRQATELVCAHIRNPEDLVRSVLLTQRDLKRLFYFPGGNIDHVELTGGQTFAARTYASDPARSFYQFGDHEGVYYCGAGAYPCGSVAGTAGYMCAQQILARGLAR